jgi:hypothetical protein
MHPLGRPGNIDVRDFTYTYLGTVTIAIFISCIHDWKINFTIVVKQAR